MLIAPLLMRRIVTRRSFTTINNPVIILNTAHYDLPCPKRVKGGNLEKDGISAAPIQEKTSKKGS